MSTRGFPPDAVAAGRQWGLTDQEIQEVLASVTETEPEDADVWLMAALRDQAVSFRGLGGQLRLLPRVELPD